MNVSTATTAELLSFFNANTGGAQVKKFADRKTAERRVAALIAEMIEEGDAEGYDLSGITAEAGIDRAPTNEENGEGPFKSAAEINRDACPSCGATLDITSGRVINRAGHQHVVDESYFTCHGCGHEWGTKDNHYVRPSGAPITSRPEMVKSLKLDRQIESVLTGIVYKNACQVWKAGLVSASQGDRLSAVLYGAAKQGNRLMSITINGHLFALAVR